MRLATTGWMEKSGTMYCFNCRGPGGRMLTSHICSETLRLVLGVTLGRKDHEIKVTMYSHYVDGSNHVVLSRRRSLFGGQHLSVFSFRRPRGVTLYTKHSISRLLTRSKTVRNFIRNGEQRDVYLLTETREVE